jgi:AcrR family transcriptional regulator
MAGTGRGGKRGRTRAALLAAARALIAAGGLGAVTLEAVAARAGMSRGAIYGNFADRDDLLIAVLEGAAAPIEPAFVAGLTLRAQLRRLGAAVFAAAATRDSAQAAALAVYAASRPEVAARVAAETAARLARREAALLALYPAMLLPMAAADFVRALAAMTEGLAGSGFAERVFVAAFEGLAG